ncbi:AbgT family transporter [Vibrio metschnikovii]
MHKAMFSALGATLLVLMMVIATLHPSGWLTPSDPTMFARSEVIKGLPIIVSLTFALSGLVFGFMSGSFKGRVMLSKAAKSMERLGLFLVIIFFASQLIFIFQP